MENLGRKITSHFKLRSAENPAYDPSRRIALRAPQPVSDTGRALLRPAIQDSRWRSAGRARCGLVLQVFAGAVGLSQVLAKQGLQTEVPYEAFPAGGYIPQVDLSRKEVFEELLDLCKTGIYSYVHFGLACSSWFIIQQLNGGSRSRAEVKGNGSNPKEVVPGSAGRSTRQGAGFR